jgi:hypothetical protein
MNAPIDLPISETMTPETTAPSEPTVKTKQVVAIAVHREFTTFLTHARYDTVIWFHRANVSDLNEWPDAAKYETQPASAKKAPISEASVLRAKRAQNLMLANLAKLED